MNREPERGGHTAPLRVLLALNAPVWERCLVLEAGLCVLAVVRDAPGLARHLPSAPAVVVLGPGMEPDTTAVLRGLPAPVPAVVLWGGPSSLGGFLAALRRPGTWAVWAPWPDRRAGHRIRCAVAAAGRAVPPFGA